MVTLYSNPNDSRRTLNTGRQRKLPKCLTTGADVIALDAQEELGQDDFRQYLRLGRRHIREVIKHMPAIRRAREQGKRPRRIPKDVLDTIAELRLV